MLCILLFYLFTMCQFALSSDVPPPAIHNGHMSDEVAQQVASMMSVWHPKSKQNIWEMSGQYEGDIMMNDESDLKNVLLNPEKRWRNGVLPYFIHKDFDEYERKAIKKGIKEIENNTCIILREYKKEDKDYVIVKRDSPGCWSYTGRQGGGQVLNLSPKCVRHGIVVHEFLHALGLFHQQSDSKRDNYITVNWENIVEGSKNNFKKYDSNYVTDFGIGYDYESIMHYGRYAFSKNDEPTITPIDKTAKIGQRRHLSEKDIKKVNIMYNCTCNNGQMNSNTEKNEEDEYYENEMYDIVFDVV